jgi:regulator of sirC expression with transglutaminase-like and TPR domain
VKLSGEAYRKALVLDANNPNSHRGLGFLYERQDQWPKAEDEFKKYLQLAPDAKDARQIRLHVESLEKAAAAPASSNPLTHN